MQPQSVLSAWIAAWVFFFQKSAFGSKEEKLELPVSGALEEISQGYSSVPALMSSEI